MDEQDTQDKTMEKVARLHSCTMLSQNVRVACLQSVWPDDHSLIDPIRNTGV